MGHQVSRLSLQIPLRLFYFGRLVGHRHWSRIAYPRAAPYMACRTVGTGEFGSFRCHTETGAEPARPYALVRTDTSWRRPCPYKANPESSAHARWGGCGSSVG